MDARASDDERRRQEKSPLEMLLREWWIVGGIRGVVRGFLPGME